MQATRAALIERYIREECPPIKPAKTRASTKLAELAIAAP
jgi:hypothetical protein